MVVSLRTLAHTASHGLCWIPWYRSLSAVYATLALVHGVVGELWRVTWHFVFAGLLAVISACLLAEAQRLHRKARWKLKIQAGDWHRSGEDGYGSRADVPPDVMVCREVWSATESSHPGVDLVYAFHRYHESRDPRARRATALPA